MSGGGGRKSGGFTTNVTVHARRVAQILLYYYTPHLHHSKSEIHSTRDFTLCVDTVGKQKGLTSEDSTVRVFAELRLSIFLNALFHL